MADELIEEYDEAADEEREELADGDKLEIIEINFPNPAFRWYVSEIIDNDPQDGYLSPGEIESVDSISFPYYQIHDIQKLQGIEIFKNLTFLDCTDNQLTSLDPNVCPKLEYLYCGGNFLGSLDVSGLSDLIELHCNNNYIESLDVSGHEKLQYLYCFTNPLNSLNVTGCKELMILSCYESNLDSLEISSSPYLIEAFDDKNYYYLCFDTSTTLRPEHSPIVIPGVAPSCTATGLTEGSKCEFCGEILKAQEILSATGHNYGDWTVTTPAACETAGEETRVCRNDTTHTETRPVDPTGHKWEEQYTTDKAPTCTESGTESIHCSVCGAVKEGTSRDVDATGHDYGEWTVLTPATCDAAGVEIRTCKNNTAHIETRPVKAIGHNWGDWTVVKAATAESEGQEQRVCKNDPEHIETRKIDKLDKPAQPGQPIRPDQPTGTSQPSIDIDIFGNTIVTVNIMESAILAQPDDNDLAGSSFGLLQAKAKKVTKNSVKLTWKRITGATSYRIYGNRCGKGRKYKKIATVSGTSFTQKKLKKGTYYKYIVVAVGDGKALATSKTIHAATSGGKVGNAKAVKIKKAKVALKTGKTTKIKASQIPQSSKRKIRKHRSIAYETLNPKIATVNKKGKIKGISKGKCTVYAYAQNGVMKAVKVTVK